MMHYIDSILKDTVQKSLLDKVYQAYMERIHTLNFTAHRSPEAFEILNIADSIIPFLIDAKRLNGVSTVLDIGTGGGFPGVPLAVLFPEQKFTLVDSVGKKMDLIKEILGVLGITNVELSPGRFEDLARTHLRESFDVVVSRAVAKWTTLLEYALPFIEPGGWLYAYQGEAVLEELEASKPVITILGGNYEEIINYTLPNDKGERYLVCIQKTNSTPQMYPRSVGIPKKSPLSIS